MGLDNATNVRRNQSLFRAINERIRHLATSDYPSFLCECAALDCIVTIDVPISAYEQTRLIPTRFIVRPEHVVPAVERAVDHREGYVVVERFDSTGFLAVAADPRRRSLPAQS